MAYMRRSVRFENSGAPLILDKFIREILKLTRKVRQ